MSTNSDYDDNSIRSLKGAERVRQRPGVMFGSDDVNAAFHGFVEIIGNSTDEVRAGFGGVIDVILHTDGSLTVKDYGRGVPMAWNEAESRFNWDLIFNELYAGGKYDEARENYKYSLGLNGLGAASAQYTSEFFEVTSIRGKEDAQKKLIGFTKFYKNFMRGVPTADALTTEDLPVAGNVSCTEIHWKPDIEVFTSVDITFKMLKKFCESQAHIVNITFTLYDEVNDVKVEYVGKGLDGYLKELLGDKLIDIFTKSRRTTGMEKNKAYDATCEVVLAITEECDSKWLNFHNTAPMVQNAGIHDFAVTNALAIFFKKLGRDNDVPILAYDYKDYMSIVISSYSNITSFANQTKNGVSNQFICKLIEDTVIDMLEEAVAMGRPSITTLLENVLTAALARKKAKEMEAQARAIKKTLSNGAKSAKFVDCRTKVLSEREFYIVEGDSALGACKAGRDAGFQCILPIKGKIINCLKHPLDDILKNEEIKAIINTLGCGVDINSEDYTLFNIDNLKVGKILICTDADVDGFQIRTLLYIMFAVLFPKLLEAGKVYIVETPLFELTDNKGVVHYAYSLDEKKEMTKDLKSKGLTIVATGRSKGLGENDKQMMWDTTMNPETRRLIQLNIDYTTNTMVRDITDMLFGKDKNFERKGFITNVLGQGLIDILETVGDLEVDDVLEA